MIDPITPLLTALAAHGDVTFLILVIFGIFALGGFTKGAISFGLPLVTVPLLSNFMSVPIAAALSMLPVLLSNAYQVAFVGSPIKTLKRFWPILLSVCLTLAFTTTLMVTLKASNILAFVGLVTFGFVIMQLAGFEIKFTPAHEKWTGFGAGILCGIMGGLTSLFSTPGIIFMSALKLPKDDFVNALSTLLFLGALVITLSLARFSVLTMDEWIISIYALIPLSIGYVFGAWLRRTINQQAFMRLILGFLLLNGVWLMAKGWVL